MELWWHEPSNYLDIVLPGGIVWRNEGQLYSKWYKYQSTTWAVAHQFVEGWILIGVMP